jgi:predicted Zn-dependent peptidase
MNDVRFDQKVLADGTVILSEVVPNARSLAVGVWLRAGSRDERPVEDGVAHFVEHLAFKGTANRDAFEIARSLEAVGGSLDAFTGRELTCYYARVLSESLPLAIDVICDLVSHPLFLDDHVEREKTVVLEEIHGLEDAPEDLVHDLVAARLWQGHPLAGSILGSESSVQSFTAGLVRGFYDRLYRTPGTIVALAGGFDQALAQRLLSSKLELNRAEPVQERTRPAPVGPALVNYRRDVSQEYICLATYTPPFTDPRRYALQLLGTVLGGGMSSRLFQAIREEAGLAYSVYTYTDFCHDTGIFCNFLAVSPEKARSALEMTFSELDKVRRNGFTQAELDSAKAQIRGGILMGLESLSSRMNRIAKSQVYHGRYQPVDELIGIFEKLTVEDVMEQTHEFLDPAGYTLVAYGPAESEQLNVGAWQETVEK